MAPYAWLTTTRSGQRRSTHLKSLSRKRRRTDDEPDPHGLALRVVANGHDTSDF